jgi:hypothetical protein
MYRSFFKSVCTKLTLNKDMTFKYISGAGSDLQIISSGKYYLNNDTIVTVSENIYKEIDITRDKNENDFFRLKFSGYVDYPVLIDSIKVWFKSRITKSASKTTGFEFFDADSVNYYLKGNTFNIPMYLNDYKLSKLIKVSLPVDYYIKKNNKTIIGCYKKTKYIKNVP